MPQRESTPFYPRSPYACAKLYAYWITVNYREAYCMFACNGILFNHESPRWGETFVSRKITRGLARIAEGLDTCLHMGNLDAQRDWGHARDYVLMQWQMLQAETAQDFVIATGEMTSVRDFIERTGKHLGMTIAWSGTGLNEIGTDSTTGKIVVRIDPRYFRPAEVEQLRGDPSKAKSLLGWQPTISLDELIAEMATHDRLLAQREALLRKHGHDVIGSYEKAHLCRRASQSGRLGPITWDTSKPNGTPRKLQDVSRLHSLGWKAATGLEAGLAKTYAWYAGPKT